MSQAESVELTPAGAADLIREELARAGIAFGSGKLDTVIDGYARALGLALQLGPAATGQVLVATLETARELAQRHDGDSLSALGPALVDLVAQVRDAGALPPTTIMEAWATVAADLGALIGQVGLALALAPDRRAGMLSQAHTRATLLDDATGGLFALADWLDALQPPAST